MEKVCTVAIATSRVINLVMIVISREKDTFVNSISMNMHISFYLLYYKINNLR